MVEEFAVSPHHVEVLQNRVPEVGNVDASTTAGGPVFCPVMDRRVDGGGLVSAEDLEVGGGIGYQRNES